MSESQEGYRARHQPSPEGFMVARTARSPGFGTPLAFPVSQWLSEWRAWPRGPGSRYSGGAAPDLHRLPNIPVRVSSVVLQRLVYWFRPPAAREVSNRALSRARSD
jgi:hypothetical protein